MASCTSSSRLKGAWIINKVSSGVPSFIVSNSLLETNHASITRVAFTPIIAYPVTEYDTINTAMA